MRLWGVEEEGAIGLWGELYEQRLYPQGADIAFVLRGLAPRGAVGLSGDVPGALLLARGSLGRSGGGSCCTSLDAEGILDSLGEV